MKGFESKWKRCAGRAREVGGRQESAPFGFAARVVALAQDRSRAAPSIESAWQRLTMQSLGLVGLLLLVCAVFELPHLHDRKPLDPGIENAVARLVWRL